MKGGETLPRYPVQKADTIGEWMAPSVGARSLILVSSQSHDRSFAACLNRVIIGDRISRAVAEQTPETYRLICPKSGYPTRSRNSSQTLQYIQKHADITGRSARERYSVIRYDIRAGERTYGRACGRVGNTTSRCKCTDGR